MKLISWNVNGLRACLKKNFLDTFNSMNADVFCLQETKMQEGQVEVPVNGYHIYWNSAEKKGYSGTAVFSRIKPLSVMYDLGIEELDKEGRVITLEYDKFFLVNCYVPNAQPQLARISFRQEFEDAMRQYLLGLRKIKHVIYCGDLNVAHNEIDLKNPKQNVGNPGFSNEEREKFNILLDSGFIDTFRALYPDCVKYSWWSYRSNARSNNVGWRIDYWLVSEELRNNIHDSLIYDDILGSDHCPVGLLINI